MPSGQSLLVCLTLLLGAPISARAEIAGTTLVGLSPLTSPSTVFATHAPGRPNELFVVDQKGLILVLDLNSGAFAPQPFLDISSVVTSGGERGLLGLAFHPDYATNGRFYVNYTRSTSGFLLTQIEGYQVANPLTAAFASTRTRTNVLDFAQDATNHNGGWIGFGPNDGYLYIAAGDGGGSNDPNNRGQSLDTLLGKMLRIDIDGDDFPTDPFENYKIPADNPFVDGDPSTLDEIWAYGLRNPWRASFDRETGDLWIGDVGQGAREEINFQSANSPGGENYGWRLREGGIETPGSVGGPEPTDHVGPVYDYSHGFGLFEGNSVVGGYAYRGPDPEPQGRYFFADTVSSRIWTYDPELATTQVINVEPLLDPDGTITTPVSFGEDAYGNLYLVTLGGGVFRIDTDALSPGDYNADGQVSIADYQKWRDDFGLAESTADGNHDGTVDAADYTLWRDAYAEANPTSGSAPSPEPQTLLIAGVALALSRASQRRRA